MPSRVDARRSMHAAIGLCLFLCLCLCLWPTLRVPAAATAAAPLDATEVPVGGRLREATLAGLNGPARKLSAFLGRPLLINVWASWCGPCRQEMASLDRLAWRGDRPDFGIIGISTDDHAELAQGLLSSTHATISQYLDTALQMEHMLGASRLPLTVLVAADGRVLLKVYGARQWDSAEALRLLDATLQGAAARDKKPASAPRPSSQSSNDVTRGSWGMRTTSSRLAAR